jgi:hypothetical protein
MERAKSQKQKNAGQVQRRLVGGSLGTPIH